MYTALSGQIAVGKQIDIIANNIANTNTSGFKAERPLFEKALSTQSSLLTTSLKKDISLPNPFGGEDYASMKASYTDVSQGNIENTGRELDVAIQGKGFFVVQTPAGEKYTRAGSFSLDSTGKLVTQSGFAVQGVGGEIFIRGGAPTISQDGSVQAAGQNVGKLRVVDIDAAKLEREPGQLFSVKDGAPSEVEKPAMVGGALEMSNVNAVRELADMIMASRLFEGFKTVQQQVSEVDTARNQKLGSAQG